MASRKVICTDTTDWIKSQQGIPSVITSLPDMEETGFDFITWKRWFVDMVTEIIQRVVPDGYSIFYQTDRKINGAIIDKSFLCNKGAEAAGVRAIWHKICLKREVGKVDLYRPTFTHLMCYSKTGNPGKATPDVMNAGKMIYKNAMGLTACRFACEFVKPRIVFDPFCGQGSILAVANKLGLDAVGVDILEDQCEKSRRLQIT